jgi:hypothetical protein
MRSVSGVALEHASVVEPVMPLRHATVIEPTCCPARRAVTWFVTATLSLEPLTSALV